MDARRPTTAELQAEVDKLSWWHSIDLGGGVVTPGKSNNQDLVWRLGLPARLDGKTVLDVGAWDGFYSFECERRGAARVLATDWYCWGGPGWGSKHGFELARRGLGSRVEDLEIDVMDLTPEHLGQFDLVLFLGVLYHLQNPLLGLQRVAGVTKSHLIVETHCDLFEVRHPAMRFYPAAQLNNDPTNWWGPNPACVEAMLRTVGFSRIEMLSPHDPNRRIFHARRE